MNYYAATQTDLFNKKYAFKMFKPNLTHLSRPLTVLWSKSKLIDLVFNFCLIC